MLDTRGAMLDLGRHVGVGAPCWTRGAMSDPGHHVGLGAPYWTRDAMLDWGRHVDSGRYVGLPFAVMLDSRPPPCWTPDCYVGFWLPCWGPAAI